MKRQNKNHQFPCSLLLMLLGIVLSFNNCTNLDEHVYDKIDGRTFLQTKEDVYRDFLRTFDHAYYSIHGWDGGLPGNQASINELTADQIMTPKRGGDWFDGGVYYQMHYHTWTSLHPVASSQWNLLYTGITLSTNSIEDIQAIDPAKFNLTDAEVKEFIAELRTMRAWFYLRLFDLYRNIEIITKVQNETKGKEQSTPQETFHFIEKELKEAMPDLFTREQFGSVNNWNGRWTKTAAASILARLYLNAKVYIGQDKYNDCAIICQDIIDGKYGKCGLEDRWDAPFDYTNAASPEVIFGFPGSYSGTHYHYGVGLYQWTMPFNTEPYFSFVPPATPYGGFNPRYAMQPGRNVDSVEYAFQLGKPFVKFQKYPDDLRLKKYRNLGGSKREGMFVYGYIDYKNAKGETVYIKNGPDGGAPYYIRDAVGQFNSTPPGQPIANKLSNMTSADHNSGVCVIKYPYYPDNDPNKYTSSYAEIRLAEIYYSLAECKYRAGDKAAAAALLNAVRKRNYPTGSASLYKPDGSQLTDQEMLDEWGREFLFENRRRIDLIRWGVYNTGIWWDKQPDPDNHTSILPIGQSVLNLNPQLKQNPGYDK